MAMDDWTQSPAKRSYSRYEDERDERGSRERDAREDRDERDGSRHKRRRPSEPDPPSSASSDTEFRILCPIAKIGSVIGKGGSIIKALRQDSRAKIKVEDVVHGADERIIYITSSSGKDHDRRDRDDREEMLCPAQDALFRIFARITDKEESDNVSHDEEEDEPASHVTVRLLVSDGQVGCLIGKGGRIIEQMRKDIAAQIRVLPKASLPPCAFPNDELVQLSGTPALVREALYAVSTKLYENPVRERPHRPSGYSQGASFPGGGMHSSFHAPGSMYGMGHYGGRTNSFPVRNSRSDGPLEEEFMICVLCPNDKIGSVIGKGGSVIRKLREESGAKIRVCDQVGDSDERVIQISALEYIDSYASPTLEAVMQVFRRLAEISADRDGRHAIFSIRLLVRANQIGCLLGKGGQIISEMRKTSRANIRIPPKEELPSCADENSELVQVSGESAMVEAALIQVLTRLRTNLFNGRGGGAHGHSGSHHGSGPTYSSRDNRDEPGSPGGYSYDYGHYNTSPGATRSSRDSRRRQR